MPKAVWRLLIILVLSAVGLFTLDRVGLLAPVHLVFDFVTVPVRRVLYVQTAALSGSNPGELSRQSRELTVLSTKLKMLEEENKSLRKQIENQVPKDKKLIVARTLGMSRYLTIDRGSRDGVKVGSSVIAENVLVGRVRQTTPLTATVLLPTDPDSKIPAWTPKLTRGMVQGSFGRSLTFDQVLQGDPLTVDETVLTSGDDGYEQNLAIATVTTLAQELRSVYKKADLTPLVDYRTIRVVYVVQDD